MPQVFQGDASVSPSDRFAIVVSRYNESITSKLVSGATATLLDAGVAEDAIDVVWVPGAWEIPLAAAKLVASQPFLAEEIEQLQSHPLASKLPARRPYAAVLCLGAVIRGETSHDRHINRAVSHQLAELAVRSGVPVLFGLLTCQTLEQAIHRAGGNVGNKGVECAQAALEMASLLKQLPSLRSM